MPPDGSLKVLPDTPALPLEGSAVPEFVVSGDMLSLLPEPFDGSELSVRAVSVVPFAGFPVGEAEQEEISENNPIKSNNDKIFRI